MKTECPICSSTYVVHGKTVLQCLDCDYNGPIVIEDKKAFYPSKQKEAKKKETVKKPKEKKVLSCEDCGLFENCITPKFPVYGNGKKKILIVKESPSVREDETGSPFSGSSGGMIKRQLHSLGIDNKEDCWTTYAVKCRKEGDIKKKEANICKVFLQNLIKEKQPEKIIIFGIQALQAVLDGRDSTTGMGKWVGRAIPDQDLGTWIFPLHSTKTLAMKNTEIPFTEAFKKDLIHAFTHDEEFPHNKVDDKDLFLMTNPIAATMYLESLKSERVVTFDYETTGLKPHAPGHEILCVSFAVDRHKAACFPVFYDDKDFMKALRKILQNPSIKKIAHNLKFEDSWTKTILGYSVKGWYWDTLIAQHCLDNRGGCNSLKDQTFFRQGIIGYEATMKPYMKALDKSEEKSNNAINRMREAPLMDMLKYCAEDSLYTFRMYTEQIEEMKGREKGFDFLSEGVIAFADAHNIGMMCDVDYFKKQDSHLEKRMARLSKRILSSEEALQWDGGNGKKPTDFNFDSGAQLGHLLYTILKYTPSKKTSGGSNSTDIEALSKYNTPFIQDILKWKKLEKLKGTYLAGMLREQVDGIIRTNFNLHTVATFRSCIAKGEKVLTSVGEIPIEEIKEGSYVYCFDDNLQLVLRKVIWSGKTGTRETLLIKYKGGRDSYHTLRTTPEHRIRSISGKYIEAQYLLRDYRDSGASKHSPKSRVLSCHVESDRLFATNHKEMIIHRFIYSQITGESFLQDEVLHHKDGNHLNNEITNLEKMKRTTHGKLHAKDTVCLHENRIKNKLAVQKAWVLGRYSHVAKRGEDNHMYLGLSKKECERLLHEAKGRLKNVQYDFATFKKYCKKHNVNIGTIKLLYNDKGVFIDSSMIISAIEEYGRSRALQILGVGHNKLKQLCAYYNISISKDQVTINNHVIVDIINDKKVVDVYDLEVEGCHNFIANEICVHNSSNSPNFQNIPKRDKESQRIIRTGLIPRPGRQLLEVDYSGVEVCISACYHQDPTMITYIKDPTTDMHRDMSRECYLKQEITKEERQLTKNKFVFPQFYGDYYKSCATSMWEEMPVETKEHLNSQGISTYPKFERHIKAVENDFWNKRFKVYNKWKATNWNKYLKDGYIKGHTGFIYGGVMDKKQASNYPIQGSAFHCLLWSFIKVNEFLKKEKMETLLIGQIHDALVLDVVPDELEYLLPNLRKIMCEDIRKYWDWIIVPLDVEGDISAIDGSWAEMNKIEM